MSVDEICVGVPRGTARRRCLWLAHGADHRWSPAMSILTALLVAAILAATALVIFFSLILAKCEDEARGMVHDTRQWHFGGGAD
jgi:hypothetical protein